MKTGSSPSNPLQKEQKPPPPNNISTDRKVFIHLDSGRGPVPVSIIDSGGAQLVVSGLVPHVLFSSTFLYQNIRYLICGAWPTGPGGPGQYQQRFQSFSKSAKLVQYSTPTLQHSSRVPCFVFYLRFLSETRQCQSQRYKN